MKNDNKVNERQSANDLNKMIKLILFKNVSFVDNKV